VYVPYWTLPTLGDALADVVVVVDGVGVEVVCGGLDMASHFIRIIGTRNQIDEHSLVMVVGLPWQLNVVEYIVVTI
jgi:hypothetical protein